MGWIGIDLDATLAEWGEGTSNPCDVMQIGDPIPTMVTFVKRLIADGVDVRIFTARIGPATDEECQKQGQDCIENFLVYQRGLIDQFCLDQFGQVLPITCTKDFHMYKLYDDRCVQVIPNTGQSLEERIAELTELVDSLSNDGAAPV